MTEKIKRAISIIENEKECVQRDCDRDCSRCELVKEESEIVCAFDLAIRSLQAWEEVIKELENEIDLYENSKSIMGGNDFDIECDGAMRGLGKAIDIINQKLVEIEE